MTEPRTGTLEMDRAAWQRKRRRRRLQGLALALLLVLALAAAGVYVLPRLQPPPAQEQYYVGEIPALRGRLLDRRGYPLAWSTRHFSLVYRLHPDVATRYDTLVALQARLQLDLQALWPGIQQADPDRSMTLAGDLNVGQLERLRLLVPQRPRLTIRSRFERHRWPGGDLAGELGATRSTPEGEEGLSGYEAKYDAKLRGTPGLYKVLVRDGRWLPETWRSIRPPEPGEDVYLPVVRPAAHAATEAPPRR